MDRIQAMRVFARVVETGSFTRAAESFDLPKGSVTRLVQKLEEHLKVRLLQRTTRRVTVTPEGAAYYERTSRLLNELDELEASLSKAQASPGGRLRVDVGSLVAHQIVIPALPGFFQRYPGIQLELGVSDRPADLIGDGVDCVIRGGELTDQSLIARQLCTVRMVTVASPSYLRRSAPISTPHDLESGQHTTLTYFSARTGRHSPQVFERQGESVEIGSRYRLSVNETGAHLAAVVAGLGVAQVPWFGAAPHLDRGELVEVLPDWHRPPFALYVLYPARRHLSKRVRAFVEWAAELFARHERSRN
jgi:DNA-binding transcriptional LysR family regulator